MREAESVALYCDSQSGRLTYCACSRKSAACFRHYDSALDTRSTQTSTQRLRPPRGPPRCSAGCRRIYHTDAHHLASCQGQWAGNICSRFCLLVSAVWLRERCMCLILATHLQANKQAPSPFLAELNGDTESEGRPSIESGLGWLFQGGWRCHHTRIVMLRGGWSLDCSGSASAAGSAAWVSSAERMTADVFWMTSRLSASSAAFPKYKPV